MGSSIPQSTSPAPVRKPRRGDVLEVRLDALERRGPAVGVHSTPDWGDFTVAVRHGAPGSRVRVEIRKRRGGRLEARTLELLEPGPHGAEPRCRHFGHCGGCAWQSVSYPAQLEALGARVRTALETGGVLGQAEVLPAEGMGEPWAYRNKMDFTFASRRWVEPDEPENAECEFALGLHAAGQHSKALDIAECSIAFPEAAAIVGTVRRLARAQGLEPWDLRTHTGLLRHLVVRKSWATGEVLVFLVTSARDAERIDPFAAEVIADHPEIATWVQGVHDRPATVASCEEEHVLHGSGRIVERLAGREFEISAQSFFQTNSAQAERLVEVVAEELSLEPGQSLVDLYCGAGTLGLCVLKEGCRLIGLESVPSAVADAQRNAERNGVSGAEFVLGDVLESLAGAMEARGVPDALIVDPPRAGLHPKVVPAVGALGAARIIYVSCNVESAARDLAGLVEAGYALVRARPLDLFPHTPHLECVLTLEKQR